MRSKKAQRMWIETEEDSLWPPASPRERRSKLQERAHYLKHFYGITVEQFNSLLDQQRGCCACCGCDLGLLESKYVHVDHDHVTNEIRGILCANCNRGIGLLKDSVVVLDKARAYLSKKHTGLFVS